MLIVLPIVKRTTAPIRTETKPKIAANMDSVWP
jgi:hypothetical protein